MNFKITLRKGDEVAVYRLTHLYSDGPDEEQKELLELAEAQCNNGLPPKPDGEYVIMDVEVLND